MDLKFLLLTGAVAVGGFAAYKYVVPAVTFPVTFSAPSMASFDPTVFPYSREQAQELLASARTTLPRRDGPKEKIQLWGAGRSAKGVLLNLQYASWAPVLKCEAVITAVAPDKSRVVPDCSSDSRGDTKGGASKKDSALGRTQDELQVPMFEEHVQATLNKRAFNRDTVSRKEAMAVFKNLGAMQREALQASYEDRRQELMAGR